MHLLKLEELSKRLSYEYQVVDEWARIYGHSWWKKGTQKVLTSKRILGPLQRHRARQTNTLHTRFTDPNAQPGTPVLPLCSNDPPNDEEETNWIHAAIRERELRLIVHSHNQLHKRELSEAVSGISRSHNLEIAQLEQQISQLKALLSPLRRLPAELLQEIFLIGAPKYRTHKFASSDISHGELVWSWAVAGVCRKWRNVALSTPELWNVLPHLTFERVNFHDHKLQHAKFKFILRCSGNLPLHVYIEARTPWLPDKCAALDLLIQHSERWETVVVKMTSSTFSYLNGVKNRIPRLKHLSLTLWHSWAHHSGVDWDMFAVAPQLTNVSFKCRSQVALRFPESQLMCYSLESMHVEGIGHALQSMSTMRTLCLRNEHMAPLRDPVTLPNLTSFFFQLRHYHSSPSLLESLSLPSLQELVICGDHKDILTASLSLLTRSAEAAPLGKSILRSLRISTSTSTIVHSNPNTILSILELSTELRFLDIPLPSVDVLIRLSIFVQGQAIAPQLECCKFQIMSPLSSTICSALNKLGSSRCRQLFDDDSHSMDSVPVSPLQYLMLEYWGNDDTQDFLEQAHHDLELTETAALSQSASQLQPSLMSSPFNFRGQRSSHTRAAVSNELWFLIADVLPLKDKSDHPITDHGHNHHVSRAQATLLTSKLSKYRADSLDASDILILRRLSSKLSLLQRRLHCTPTKLKLKYIYLGELESVVDETLKAWYAIVDQHASTLRWVHDASALFYISQLEYPSRRSSLDSCCSSSSSLAQEYRTKLEDLCSKVLSV